MVTRWFALALALALALTARTATADRVKDLTTVAGVRTNQLTGYGLVVGLAGTGDDASSPIVRRTLAKALKRLDIAIAPEELRAKNVAAVMITAELPPFARPGQAIDVVVSSFGSAKSLAGGTLPSWRRRSRVATRRPGRWPRGRWRSAAS